MVLRQPAADALHFDFARAWREPPGMATSTTLRLSGAFFLALGGVLLMVCAPLLPASQATHLSLFFTGLLGVGAGVMFYAIGDLLPRWFFEVLVVVAVIGIALLVRTGPGALHGTALAAALLLPVSASALLLPLRRVVFVALLAVALNGWAMYAVGATSADVIMVQGCALGMAGMVAWLARVADAAERDALTSLPNRRGVERSLESELLRLEREGGQFALAAFDLDYFKRINDTAGQLYGDRVIVDCVTAWTSVLDESAVLCRYGGDQFVVLLPDTPLGLAADITDRLRAATPENITVSAGVAAWQYGDSQSMLLQRAEVALYDAKSSGRDRTVVYGDPDREASELEAAITNGEMRLLLQPVVGLPTGEPSSFEALIRWERPGRGVVSPLDFVPQAERTGAIHSLGAWVLAESCRLAMTLPEPRRAIGVNVSVHELRRSEYAGAVRQLLEQWQMPGSLLVVEVTESVFEDDEPQVIKNLHDLRALGARIAIDDFGAGYSSLRRIENLPIDVIKVDGALVCSIREDRDPAILRAIVTMARSLDVKLVAEHVETDYQASLLHELGYDLAQGYYFGKPAVPEPVLSRPQLN